MIYIKKLNMYWLFEMNSLNIRLLLGSVVFFLMTSCESFLEIDPPQSEITGEIVFEDTATATAAISEVYARLREDVIVTGSYGGVSYGMALYADELDYFGGANSQSSQSLYNNSVLPTSSVTTGIWSGAYNLIYQTNNIIDGIDNSISLEQKVKDQIKGEALFIRACIHFYLVNLYGDIPYIITPDYRQNSVVSRLPEQEVYSFLISDLVEAKELLPDAYVAFERIRANKGVASALLSRAYLYSGQWDKASTESTSLINNTGLYIWETNLSQVFLKGSTAAIWQLKPSFDGVNTKEGEVFIFNGSPFNGALSNQLINDFEPGDQRLTQWIGSTTDGTNTWYYPFKYKERSVTSGTLEYSVIFRLAEQYLIRAEARAQQGDISGAKQDLNVLRTRAGLPNTTASGLNDLLDAILQERKVELFTEQGHRFFDLKRMGKADAILGTIKPGWDAKDILLPVPESELLVNPNLLPQNSGY